MLLFAEYTCEIQNCALWDIPLRLMMTKMLTRLSINLCHTHPFFTDCQEMPFANMSLRRDLTPMNFQFESPQTLIP